MAELSPDELQAQIRAAYGDVIDVKPIVPEKEDLSDSESESEVVDLITRVCYFYPQYTLETAQQLTHGQVTALLLQAEKQRAIEFYNHVLIAAAPHSKKGVMIGKLTKHYKKIADS